jgi:hypothetical protein
MHLNNSRNSFKLLKFIEICIKLKKRQINFFLESLSRDLHNKLEESVIFTVTFGVNFQESKFCTIYLQKYVQIQILKLSMPTPMLISSLYKIILFYCFLDY